MCVSVRIFRLPAPVPSAGTVFFRAKKTPGPEKPGRETETQGMPKTSLMLVHDTSAPAFDPAALRDNDGEPRIRDIDLAQRLGFAEDRAIRKIITRNLHELRSHGTLGETETGSAGIWDAASQNASEGISATAAENRGRGRPGKEYWLNEGQALVICALSRTPQASLVRKALIECFLAYRRGQLPVEHQAAQSFAQLAAEVAELRQRVALIGAAPHIRATYRGGCAIPGVVGLSVRDLSLEHDGEARVYDERVGVQLGLPDPETVRKLVRSHRGLMSGLGRVVTVAGAALARRNLGRPQSGFWLTEMQALAVCGLVSGNVASTTRSRIIKVFAEFRRGQEEIAAGGGLIAIHQRDRTIAELRERLEALEDTARITSRKEARRRRHVDREELLSEQGDVLYGLKAIGAFLNVEGHQADAMIRKEGLPYFRLNGRVCARKTQVSAWVETKSSKAWEVRS